MEVFATVGKIVVGGEITSKAKVSYDKIVAGVINRIDYTMSDLCGDPHDLLELETRTHVLPGMTVRSARTTGQRFDAAVKSCFPEIDVRFGLVVFPAGPGHSIFLCIPHQGVPKFHILCYTVHEI